MTLGITFLLVWKHFQNFLDRKLHSFTSFPSLKLLIMLRYFDAFSILLSPYLPMVIKFESIYQKCSIKKAGPKNFVIFTGKHLCWSRFLIKLQAFRSFAFWIAQNNALVALRQWTVTKAYTRNQHFWEFGGLSLGFQIDTLASK